MRRVALVTGGAKGIGAAIVKELAKADHDIVLNYNTSKEKALALAKECSENYGVKVLPVRCDISKEEDLNAMFEIIEDEFGGVDIIINNAAVDYSNLWHEKTNEQFRKTLDVNLIAVFNICKKGTSYMMDRGWGRIVNIASTNGMNTYFPMCLEYDASKAALISLTHNLAWNYSPYITVNAVAPGFIGTESELEGYDKEFLEQEEEKIMLKRYGDPEEVAKVVRFLVSDDASYINNTVIRVDGGQYGA